MFQETFIKKYDLVIFDRDGVINLAPRGDKKYILSKKDLRLNPVIINFILGLQENGLATCVATNQQCVGKGLISAEQLDEIHDAINLIILKAGGEGFKFFSCPHLIREDCPCRKPKPGLLLQALEFFGVTPSRAIFIGDQISDKIAANLAGLDFIFIDSIDFH
jgi:D-glycero-D-manno-heptose 1,7-bisphosphate phosphatase